MKRDATTRRLHMGCGEELIGRVVLLQRPAAKGQALRSLQVVHGKVGKGRR